MDLVLIKKHESEFQIIKKIFDLSTYHLLHGNDSLHLQYDKLCQEYVALLMDITGYSHEGIMNLVMDYDDTWSEVQSPDAWTWYVRYQNTLGISGIMQTKADSHEIARERFKLCYPLYTIQSVEGVRLSMPNN